MPPDKPEGVEVFEKQSQVERVALLR